MGITFTGDGASNQGTFLESMNLAAVWNLPVILVIENNDYAESTARLRHGRRSIATWIARRDSAFRA